jgi:hypothetical protein
VLSEDGQIVIRNVESVAEGLPAMEKPSQRDSAQPLFVPRIIHQTFKTHITGKFPNPVWEMSERSWKHFFPEGNGTGQYRYMQWSDDEITHFFAANCEPQVGPLPNYSNRISVSDLARYCILWKLGGIYADLDYEPRAHFYDRFASDRVSLVQSPYGQETYQNSLMASPPRMPYWLDALSQAMMSIHNKGDANDLSGPRLLETLPASHDPQVVRMLPCREFQRATHLGNVDGTKGCGMLTRSNAHEVLGIHWGTWSWIRTNAMGEGLDASPETTKLFGDLLRELHPDLGNQM